MTPSRHPAALFRSRLVAFWLVGAIANLAPSVTFAQSEFIGRASCAASTCHGGVLERGPAWRSSLSRWVSEDPHASAGLALRNDLSEKIVMSLNPGIADLKAKEIAAGVSPDEASWTSRRDALLRERCISCHVTVSPEQCTSGERLEWSLLAEGVSCESCHGAASPWIDKHIETSFTGPSRFDAGLHDTESIVGRAEGCVRCHVGSRTDDGLVRDMNHDLIAAGHPVLRFDLALYDEALPRHWDTASSPRFYESRLRVRKSGRAAALAAAARLAGQRAEGFLDEETSQVSWEDRRVPMPELSDYDCFACHQSLSMDQYLLPPATPGSALQISAGLPIWNSWHTMAQLELKKDQLKTLAPTAVDTSKAGRLAKIGAGIAGIYSDRAKQYAEASPDPSAELEAILDQRLAEGDDWHQAAINYLDIIAALQDLAAKDAQHGLTLRRMTDETQGFLKFDQGFHSPANFDIRASKRFADTVREILSSKPEPNSSNPSNLTN